MIIDKKLKYIYNIKVKKILLLTTPSKNSINIEVTKNVSKNTGNLPPLGLLYIAAFIRHKFRNRIEIKILNCQNKNYDELAEFIKSYKPDIAGISAFTHSLADVVLTAKLIKEKLPQSLICVGGPHANNFPEQLASLKICDIIIPQNGEEIFGEIVQTYLNGGNFNDIKGIYRNNVFTQKRDGKSIPLHELPFPAIDLYDFKKNSYILDCETPMTTMISAKGCRNDCHFCNTPKTIEIRPLENILDEILYYRSFGIKEIYFVDDTFNITENRLRDFSNALLSKKIKLSWSCRLRTDCLKPEDLMLAKKSGCHTVHFGVETSTNEGLKSINKNITVEETETAFFYAREYGIRTMAYFMIGLPFEKNHKDIEKTLNFAKKLKCSYALFNVFVPFPDTYLYNKALEKNIIKKSDWDDYLNGKNFNFTPPVWSEYFLAHDLISELNLINKDFYLNLDYISRFLSDLKNYHFPVRKFKAFLGI